MRDFQELLAQVSRELESRALAFMVIGGQAVLLHGRPRLTEDIDLTVAADPRRVGDLVAVCSASGLEPLPEDVEAFATRTYVLPSIDPVSRLRVDFIFSTTPYERQAIQRAIRVSVAGQQIPFATAEDLIIHKLFAARPRDLEDAIGVARRQGDTLDWSYIERWAEEFAAIPGREDMPERLRQLRSEA
ncbi:MAG: nucleotidyl transferase AbiEii/AbiGii toxin family protein [Gemmatimonadota bacterium]